MSLCLIYTFYLQSDLLALFQRETFFEFLQKNTQNFSFDPEPGLIFTLICWRIDTADILSPFLY